MLSESQILSITKLKYNFGKFNVRGLIVPDIPLLNSKRSI